MRLLPVGCARFDNFIRRGTAAIHSSATVAVGVRSPKCARWRFCLWVLRSQCRGLRFGATESCGARSRAEAPPRRISKATIQCVRCLEAQLTVIPSAFTAASRDALDVIIREGYTDQLASP